MEKTAMLFWRAMADYAYWRELGSSREDALELVGQLYPPAFSSRVKRETVEEIELLKEQFPSMSCYDCARCEMARAGQCRGAADAAAFAKVDAAIAHSQVSQTSLLDRLRELLG